MPNTTTISNNQDRKNTRFFAAYHISMLFLYKDITYKEWEVMFNLINNIKTRK